ncbi:lipoxygenase family protein [Antrihabitans cavernicola]|uniref:AraC family transcriptional regulator n=1 Tax=Antrihabitans cavernicola TaxID=2495913 RepID=A0A5A7S772_9NOCA|nr:lipoxygenase family protein [Spelaeibacter cavernicola]KAA0021344.1 AraC family transcriptional regulator [Spelaeibacter cavernicola]
MSETINRRQLLRAAAMLPLVGAGLASVANAAPAGADAPPALPLLPQFDPAPWARQAALVGKKGAYVWTENVPFLPGIPAANFVPLDAIPTIEWWLTAADAFFTIGIDVVSALIPVLNAMNTSTLADARNQMVGQKQELAQYHIRFKNLGNGKYNMDGPRLGIVHYDVTDQDMAEATLLQAEVGRLFNEFWLLLGNVRQNLMELIGSQQGIGNFGSKQGLAEYNAIFGTMPIPDVASNVHDDKTFAWMQQGGFDTNVLRQVRELPANFPLTDAQYREGIQADDGLAAALAAGRVYMCDYVGLGKMASEQATYKVLLGDTWHTAPIVLYALPPGKGDLEVVAIQCGQNSGTSPMFVRPRPDDKDRYWGWQMAKTSAMTAAWNYHEMFSHLGMSHLISEVFTVSLNRTIAPNHPLYQLMSPHAEGDIFINFLAATIIMPPKSFADDIVGGEINLVCEEVVNQRLAWNFHDRMIPNDIARRGLNNPQLDHPVRDDSTRIWNALHDWIDDYVRLYYHNDGDVTGDQELTDYCNEVINIGKMKGFSRPQTVSQLVDLLTMVAYTASAYHASVNFPQAEFMTYAPFGSGTTTAPPPTEIRGHTEADWLRMLPGMFSAVAQFTFLHQLATVYYRPLGDYRTNAFPFPTPFSDPRVFGPDGPLTKFRNRLDQIEAEINEANRSRFQPYEFLLPKNIPTSTNI